MNRASTLRHPAPLPTRVLLQAREGRLGAVVYNDTATPLLVLLDDAQPTSDRFTAVVPPQGEWRLPAPDAYEGVVSGALLTNETATGAVHVTETFRA